MRDPFSQKGHRRGYFYGFNGQMKDDEVYGPEGTSYSFQYRAYDSRIGRFLSIDPLTSAYPSHTPYAFATNRVIDCIDLEGAEPMNVFEAQLERNGEKVGTVSTVSNEDIIRMQHEKNKAIAIGTFGVFDALYTKGILGAATVVFGNMWGDNPSKDPTVQKARDDKMRAELGLLIFGNAYARVFSPVLIKASNTLKTSRFTGVNTKAGAVKGAIGEEALYEELVSRHGAENVFRQVGLRFKGSKRGPVIDIAVKESDNTITLYESKVDNAAFSDLQKRLVEGEDAVFFGKNARNAGIEGREFTNKGDNLLETRWNSNSGTGVISSTKPIKP